MLPKLALPDVMLELIAAKPEQSPHPKRDRRDLPHNRLEEVHGRLDKIHNLLHDSANPTQPRPARRANVFRNCHIYPFTSLFSLHEQPSNESHDQTGIPFPSPMSVSAREDGPACAH
jgi:hypothetical protein